jgi:probable F420-dependent oxidoreductase
MALDIGPVGIWAYGLQPGDDTAEAVAELDDLGYGALWLGSSDGGLELQESLLAASRRLVLATAIISIWLNPPARVAASYQRVERSHPGRMLIGLGSSHAGRTQGQEYRRPFQKMVGYLDELDALRSTVPKDRRVLAALGPKMLRLAGERSAGVHPYLVTPAHTKKAREILGPRPLLAPEQKVLLETDPVKAREVARETTSLYLSLPNYANNLLRLGFTTDDLADGGSDRLVDAVIAWGDADAVVKRIAEHHAAGADHVAIQVLTPGDYGQGSLPRQQWRELAAALKART